MYLPEPAECEAFRRIVSNRLRLQFDNGKAGGYRTH